MFKDSVAWLLDSSPSLQLRSHIGMAERYSDTPADSLIIFMTHPKRYFRDPILVHDVLMILVFWENLHYFD